MMAEEVGTQKWNRVIFNFHTGEGKWQIKGVLRSLRRMARAIFASLPITVESMVFKEKEVFIRLDESLKGEFSKEDRVHRAEEGSIIYRPQIPALSLFSDYSEIYEPVEKLGEIQRDSLEELKDLCTNSASVMLTEMVSGEDGES